MFRSAMILCGALLIAGCSIDSHDEVAESIPASTLAPATSIASATTTVVIDTTTTIPVTTTTVPPLPTIIGWFEVVSLGDEFTSTATEDGSLVGPMVIAFDGTDVEIPPKTLVNRKCSGFGADLGAVEESCFGAVTIDQDGVAERLWVAQTNEDVRDEDGWTLEIYWAGFVVQSSHGSATLYDGLTLHFADDVPYTCSGSELEDRTIPRGNHRFVIDPESGRITAISCVRNF